MPPETEEQTTQETDDTAAPTFGDPVVVEGEPAPESAEPIESEATEPDEVQRLREENARLRGQIEGVQIARPAEPPKREEPPQQWTPGLVRQAYEDGKITDDERVTLLARLEAARMRVEDDERRSLDEASAELEGHISKYPDLAVRGSALLGEVQQQLREWQRRNPRLDVTDQRTQVMAIDAVLKRKGAPAVAGNPGSPSAHEIARRRIPVGGSAGTAGDGADGKPKPGKSKGETLWARLTPATQQFFRSSSLYGGNPGDPGSADMKRIYKSLEYADEAMLAKHGRLLR